MNKWSIIDIETFGPKEAEVLFEKKVPAFRIKNYCNTDTCSSLTSAIINHTSRTNYAARWSQAGNDTHNGFENTDVDRVGSVDSSLSKDEPTAIEMIRILRRAAAPHYHPIDRLRLELDENFLGGAGLHRNPDGSAKLAGVGRIMEFSNEIIHADVGRRHCLTANIYLCMPKTGGGTRLWNFDGDFTNASSSYRFHENEIPQSTPSMILEPENGDLIIWNPVLPHVVLPFENGLRVSLQTWLYFSSDKERAHVTLLN